MSFFKTFHAGPKPVWIRYMLILGAATLLTRLGLDSYFAQSSFFYCLVPYLIGVILYICVPQPKGWSRTKRFVRHMLAAIIVMLASSAILFEGFLCVMMAAPIYLLFAGMAFALGPGRAEYDRNSASDVFKISLTPLIVLIVSVEGMTDKQAFQEKTSLPAPRY